MKSSKKIWHAGEQEISHVLIDIAFLHLAEVQAIKFD